MRESIPEPRNSGARDALNLLEEALRILDAIDAPAHIGAYVDLAMCELRDVIEGTLETGSE